MESGQDVAFHARSGPESRGLAADNKSRGIINHKTRRAPAGRAESNCLIITLSEGGASRRDHVPLREQFLQLNTWPTSRQRVS